MKLYKVLFENNEAVSAIQMDNADYKSVKVELDENNKVVKWITVFATDEPDAKDIANKVVRDYFSFK